ncbi:MAG: alpha/beta hydrolase [Hellea sp.]|nr:alpha/beta hydrolase [Hellea sp.]
MSFKRNSYDMPGGTMSALHVNESKGRARLVFAHANGFNGQTYRAILGPLNVHSIAVDLRGHGFTDLPTNIKALKGFQIFADDLVTFISRNVPGKVILSGHSFGAVAAILAAPQLTDRLAGYVGFDPVSMPWIGRQWPNIPGGRAWMKKYVPIAKNARNRRRQFDSLEAAFKRYKGRAAFKKVPDEILKDYLKGGMEPNDNGMQLSCDPEWEQAVFCAQAHNLYKAARFLPKNSKAHYAGKFAVSSKGTRAKLGRVIGQNNIIFNPKFSHLFPIQEPEYAAGALTDCIKHADWE